MKHRKNYLACFFVCFCISLSSLTFAQEYNTDIFIPEIADGMGTYNVKDALKESRKASDALAPQNVFEFLIYTLKGCLSGANKALFSLVAVIFISSIISCFKNNLLPSSGILDYITLLVSMLVCFSLVKPLVASVSEYLEKYVSFMTSMTSAMTVLQGASGGVAAATTSSASAAFITGITQVFSVNVVLPCIRVVVAISAISTLSSSIDLSGVINFVKSFCTWGLGALFAVFGGVHSVAVKVSGSADSLAVRGIRFTAARLIPVAGNMVSESLKTVISGMNVIRTASGGLGIAYILYSLIPAICSVMCVKLIILAASFCSKLMGQRRHTGFFDGVNSALNILLAVCIFSSVSGILIFAVFMNTATVI